MNNFTSLRIVLLAIACMGVGCTSVVYSPFATLPSQPLHKDQHQLAANLSGLPEVAGGTIYTSGEGLIRHAFSDRLTLQARAWSKFNRWVPQLDGFSFEGMYMLSDSASPYRFVLMPRAEFMLDGRSIDGRAGMVSLAAWTPTILFFKPYAAFGSGVGSVTIENNNEDNSTTNHWGFAMIGNVGANVDVGRTLSVNLEVAGIYQYNVTDKGAYWYVVPTAGLQWTF